MGNKGPKQYRRPASRKKHYRTQGRALANVMREKRNLTKRSLNTQSNAMSETSQLQSQVVQHVKVEPGWDGSDEETLHNPSAVLCVKQELCVTEETASLYMDHEVKHDVVVGPEVLQPQDYIVPFFAPLIYEVATVKQEPSDTDPEQVATVKQEPSDTEPQQFLRKRYSDKVSDQLIRVRQKPSCTEAQAVQACSVRLERLPQYVLDKYLNLEHNLNKKVIAFTCHTCYRCGMKFVERKNLEKPYTCHACVRLIPEPFVHVYKVQDANKLFKRKWQHKDSELLLLNVPNENGQGFSPGIKKSNSKHASKKKKIKKYTDFNLIIKKYDRSEINIMKEKMLAKDLLERLLHKKKI